MIHDTQSGSLSTKSLGPQKLYEPRFGSHCSLNKNRKVVIPAIVVNDFCLGPLKASISFGNLSQSPVRMSMKEFSITNATKCQVQISCNLSLNLPFLFKSLGTPQDSQIRPISKPARNNYQTCKRTRTQRNIKTSGWGNNVPANGIPRTNYLSFVCKYKFTRGCPNVVNINGAPCANCMLSSLITDDNCLVYGALFVRCAPISVS